MKLDKMRSLKITQVLKVNDTVKGFFPFEKMGIKLKQVLIEDHPAYELSIEDEVNPCLQFIHESIERGEGTLVVCTAGMSRSATICIAYLMKYKRMSYTQAFDLAKKARPYVNPNKGFVKFLKEYENKVGCELCRLEKKTQWFEKHSECKANLWFSGNKDTGFKILICDQCDAPIIVYTGGHVQELTSAQYSDVTMMATSFGNMFYGVGNWFIDCMQRTIPDHFHWHIRRIDYDSHIPLFRVFGGDNVSFDKRFISNI